MKPLSSSKVKAIILFWKIQSCKLAAQFNRFSVAGFGCRLFGFEASDVSVLVQVRYDSDKTVILSVGVNANKSARVLPRGARVLLVL
jgi:hypothetical protein